MRKSAANPTIKEVITVKHFKKSLAVILAMIIALSSMVIGISASADDYDFTTMPDETKDLTYGIVTKFYHEVDGAWVPTDGIVKRGENVKARITILSNYNVGSIDALFAYDKDFYELIWPSNDKFTINSKHPLASLYDCSEANQRAGASVVNRLKTRGVFDDDDVAAIEGYDFVVANFTTPTNVNDLKWFKPADDPEESWLFEFDLKVKNTADPDMVGETGDFLVYRKSTAMASPTIRQGAYVNIPHRSLTGIDSGDQTMYWLVKEPMLQSDPQKVVNDVVFFANGGKFADGSEIATGTGYVGDSVASAEAMSYFDMTAPTKTGATLKGWYEADKDGNKVGTSIVPTIDVDFDVNYYIASWGEGAPVITLNANDGAFPSGSEEADFTGEPGAPATFNDMPTRDGYELAGWALTPDAATGEALPTTFPDASTTYYAVWTPLNYKLTYYAPDDIPSYTFDQWGESVEKACDSDLSYPDLPASMVPDGYLFIKWRTFDPDTHEYSDAPAKMPASDLDVYAFCSPVPNTVSYFVDGKKIIALELDTDSEIPTTDNDLFVNYNGPKADSDKFDGWYTDPECTTPLADDSVTPAGGINLYAKTSVPAVFDPNGGTIDGSTDKVTKDTPFMGNIETPADPVKEGYKFIGWNPNPGVMDSTDGYEFIAVWEEDDFNMTYYVEGSDTPYDSFSFKYGADVNEIPADPTVAGKNFLGWSTVKDDASKIEALPTTMPAKDLVYYAIFEIDNTTYDVEYYIEGETAAAHVDSYASDADIVEWTAPDKEGCVFDGWYKDNSYSEKYDFDKMPEETVKVYGKYTFNKYKITYYLDGEKYEDEVILDFGDDVEIKAKPEKKGSTVSDWTWTYTNDKGETVNTNAPTTMPSHDLVANATSTVNSYALTYYVDGEEYSSSNVEYGTAITPAAAPEKAGYTFKGWNPAPPATMPDEPVDVYGEFEINDYTITYKVDGQQSGEVDTVEYNAAVTEREEPTKTGYTFSGWSWSTADGKAPATMPADNLIVEGTFEVNKHDVTFNNDDGSEFFKRENVEYGDPVPTPPTTPSKEGYVFDGWTPSIPDTMPDDDVTFEPTWKKQSYKVTYDLNGGKVDDSTANKEFTVEFGDTVPTIANPEKDGYTFVCWNNEVPATMPARDLTFKAVWVVKEPDKANYTVTVFEMGTDGTYPTDGKIVAYGNGDVGTVIKLDDFAAAAPQTGFSVDADYASTDVTSATLSKDADSNLVIHYKRDTASITWDPNGGKFSDDTTAPKTEDAYVGSETTPPTVTKEGYTFDGWDPTPDGTVSEDKSYTAKWTVNKNDVTYKLDGGNINGSTADVVKEDVEYGAAIPTCDTPVKTGYTFKEWTPSAPATMPDEPLTFTAVYEAKNCPASFDAKGGEFPAGSVTEKDIPYGEQITADDIAEPSKEGYTFKGWSTNPSATEPDANLGTMDDEDGVVVYAVWAVNNHKITYDANGGVFSDGEATDEVSYDYGTAVVNHEQPTNGDNRFTEWVWYDAEDTGKTTPITAPTTMPDKDLVAVANYTDRSKAIFYYDYENDSHTTVDVKAGDVGEDITAPSAPSKTGCEFLGWYEILDGTVSDAKVDDFGKFTASDRAFTAKWSTPVGTASFDANGGKFSDGSSSKTTSADEGQPITKPEDPTKDGYVFAGWADEPDATTEDVINDLGNMPAEGKDYYAVWTPADATVKFDANGGKFSDGSAVKDVPSATDAPITAPTETPTKDGFDFLGWSKDPNATAPDASLGNVTNPEETVYAVWKAKDYTIKYYTTDENTPAITENHKAGDPVTPAAGPAITGYTFDHWDWYDADKNPISAPTTMPAGDVIAIGKYTTNKHNATYKLDGGKIDDSTADVIFTDVPYGAAVPTPPVNPTKEGYIFAGWDPTVDTTMPDKDVTYTAKWKSADESKHVVDYIVDGVIVDAFSVGTGDVIPGPTNIPGKPGYKFAGWKWFDKDGNEIPQPSVMPDGDIHAEAQWEKDNSIVPPIIPIPDLNITDIVVGGINIIGDIIDIIKDLPLPTKPENPDAPTEPGTPDEPTEPSHTDPVDIPDTGSATGIAVFATISVAVATAYVIVKKKDEDENK